MKRVFITGGASGLGRALALRWARDGACVCVGDVDAKGNAATLAALRATGATAIAVDCDVRSEDDFDAVARRLEQEWGGVDVVVNNAGVAVSGPAEVVGIPDWRWIIDVNLLGVVRGSRAFIPLLRRGGGGHIVNIASLAGLVHLPMASAYNATKAAVVAFSETLRVELEPDGIAVTVVCPWFFRTNIASTARSAGDDLGHVARRLISEARLGADDVADIIIRDIEGRPMHLVPQREALALWLVKRALPWVASSMVFGAVIKGARRLDNADADWRPYRRER